MRAQINIFVTLTTMYTSTYLLMHEIAWPRQMLLEIAQEFSPKLLKRQTALRKFKYVKNAATELYEKFEKYHDNEISKKSWSRLFIYGFKMKTARQNGKGYFYAGPESIQILNNLLEKIPEEGGFYFDSKNPISIIKSLEIPEIKMPEIKVKTETEPVKEEINKDFNNLHEETKPEETIKEAGKIIH